MLTTGIGSLPFTDIAQALDYSFQHDLPFLPQLPQLNEEEMMVIQALDDSFATYACFEPFLEMAITKNTKKVKLQLAGPITCSLVTERPIDGIVTQLLAKVEDMIRPFWDHDIEVIFFIDEPMLFVSAASPLRETIKKFINDLKSKDLLVGLHCCSNPEWEPLLNLGFDYLSFDGHVSYSDLVESGKLEGYKKSGGKVIIGLDPRQKIGFDFKLADYISYSCGMGTLSHEDAYDILRGLNSLK